MKVERIIPRELDDEILETYKKSNEFYIDSVLHKLNNLLVIAVDDDRISPKYKIIDIDTGTVLRDCERNERIYLCPYDSCWEESNYRANYYQNKNHLSNNVFPIGEGLYFDEVSKNIYYKNIKTTFNSSN